MNRLEESIRRLYLTFASVRRPNHIDGCPCCIDGKNIDRLLKTKLTEISAEDISPYASSAFMTVGDTADYLYFLPRILELTSRKELLWPDPEVTTRAIASTKLESWPVARREALMEYLDAMIESILEGDQYAEIDSWMCAIARMNIDVRPYLDRIGESTQAVLTYFEMNSASLTKGRLGNAFWKLPCEGHDITVEWFHSEPIRRIIFDAYGFEF